jgi:ribosomal protein S18 acetylase RimI-like enzyme
VRARAACRILGTLVPELAKRPFAFSVLAFVDGEPAGLLNCFEGFSTFAAKPLVNVHDCCVVPSHRRKGISLKMLEHCEVVARERGCCKITLEVLEQNEPAKASYSKFGMQKEYAWWQKKLT